MKCFMSRATDRAQCKIFQWFNEAQVYLELELQAVPQTEVLRTEVIIVKPGQSQKIISGGGATPQLLPPDLLRSQTSELLIGSSSWFKTVSANHSYQEITIYQSNYLFSF